MLKRYRVSQLEKQIFLEELWEKKRAELEKQKQRFIDGAFKNGINKDIAAGIFLKIEPFAEYGFNKSHAAAYAVIAYQTAFLKTYYPHEFFAASMSMELSNQNKLSEFYEELKRLNINVIRPNINTCFADFTSNGKDFLYALGAIKNVGFEAISNVIKERSKNGKYKNISDFINRTNPKNINKLQLEGLVRAGAFDEINNNRKSLFSSIPNIILKSKNNFENKMDNQIELFDDEFEFNDNFLEKIEDWKTDEKLSKEFETLGFFISDHPLNQYSIIFNQYNIISYDKFENDKNKLSSNVACTVLKVQEKKTQKGNSYAIVKLSDLSSVFEIFIFSDIFEINRDKLIEGKSLMITLMKNYIDDEKIQKKINIKKIVTLADVLNKNFDNLKFKINNIEELIKFKNLKKEGGKTKITFQIFDKGNNFTFSLNDKRNIDNNLINDLNIRENILSD